MDFSKQVLNFFNLLATNSHLNGCIIFILIANNSNAQTIFKYKLRRSGRPEF